MLNIPADVPIYWAVPLSHIRGAGTNVVRFFAATKDPHNRYCTTRQGEYVYIYSKRPEHEEDLRECLMQLVPEATLHYNPRFQKADE